MKIEIKEAKPNPKDSQEYQAGNIFQYLLIFEGEVDCIHFRSYDEKIAVPSFIKQCHDGTISIIYQYPSNIRAYVEEDATGKTLWCFPAIEAEELSKLVNARMASDKQRRENLALIQGGSC